MTHSDRFVESTVVDEMPDVLALDPRTILRRYVDAHDEELDDFDQDIISVVASKQINNATGEELDELGKLFGVIGRRGNRNDTKYRQFLKSIVQSFDGRGTKPGMRFAIGAALGVGSSEVTITEDFSDLAYTVELYEWTEHSVSTVEDIAQLADPSAVEQLGTTYILDPDEMASDDSVSVGGGVSSSDSMTMDDSLTVDANLTTTSDSMTFDDSLSSLTKAKNSAEWSGADDDWDFSEWVQDPRDEVTGGIEDMLSDDSVAVTVSSASSSQWETMSWESGTWT